MLELLRYKSFRYYADAKYLAKKCSLFVECLHNSRKQLKMLQTMKKTAGRWIPYAKAEG